MTTIRGSFCLHVSRCRLSLTIFSLALLLLGGCSQPSSQEGVTLPYRSTLKVNVFAPQRIENATKVVNYFGKVKANRKSTLGFPVAGQVKLLPGIQREYLSGATIATLDSTTLDAQRESVTRAIEQSLQGSSDNERSRQLQAQLAEIDAQIQKLSIIAPFNCVIEQLHTNENSIVGARSPVVTVLETAVKVEVSVPRRYAMSVKPAVEYDFKLNGQQIQCILRDGGVAFSESPPGHLQLIFDIKSGTNLGDDFRIDQPIEAKFRFETGLAGYWLPISSLVENSNGTWSLLVVEKIDRSSIVVELPIEIAQVRDDSVLCTTDLESKLVIRDGIHRVVAGQRVEAVVPRDSSLSETGSLQ